MQGCVRGSALLALVLAISFLSVSTSATSSKRVFLESGTYVTPSSFSQGPPLQPREWVVGPRVEANTPIKLTIAIKQSNLDKLDTIFWDVSNPKSPRYGEYLTGEEVDALVASDPEHVRKVEEWLVENGVERNNIERPLSDFVTARTDAATAERLLQCPFHRFTHRERSSLSLVRCSTDYSVPEHVAPLLDFVGGVRHFPKVRKQIINPRAEALAGQKRSDLFTTPSLLRSLYNVGNVVNKSPGNSQSVVQFIGQFYASLDLAEFFDLFYPTASGQTPKIVGPDDGMPGVEASLDIEYIMALGALVPTTFWSNQQSNEENEHPFLDWLLEVGNTTNPPFVFSVSYGEDEVTNSQAYALRVGNEFQKQGARGISILFASGDSGVGGSSFGCTAFLPDFPADCPYVTAVGGTALPIIGDGPEVVNSLSGGGFSNYFDRPTYQQAAVAAYLRNNNNRLPPASKWNSTGRAYPDVSAMSNDFVVVIDLIPNPGVAGTSCAAPTFSGIIALLNDLRLQAGKKQLGFLNQFIYQNPGAFNDITQGSNPGCGTTGFKAAAGWDPASGVGSPDYQKLKAVVLAL